MHPDDLLWRKRELSQAEWTEVGEHVFSALCNAVGMRLVLDELRVVDRGFFACFHSIEPLGGLLDLKCEGTFGTSDVETPEGVSYYIVQGWLYVYSRGLRVGPQRFDEPGSLWIGYVRADAPDYYWFMKDYQAPGAWRCLRWTEEEFPGDDTGSETWSEFLAGISDRTPGSP